MMTRMKGIFLRSIIIDFNFKERRKLNWNSRLSKKVDFHTKIGNFDFSRHIYRDFVVQIFTTEEVSSEYAVYR